MKRETLEIMGLTILIPFVIISLWACIIHEPAHYVAGIIQGGECTMMPPSITCLPGVRCENIDSFSAPGIFLLSMMPHLIDLLILAAFIKTKNRFIRLIPYTAFFDLQSNLSIPIIEKILWGLGLGDGFAMLWNMQMIHPEYSGIAALLLYTTIIFSIAIFYKYYRSDFTEHKDKRFLKAALVIFLAFMSLTLLFASFVIPLIINKTV